MKFGDTRNASLDYSGKAEGKVEVWDQLAATTFSNEVLHYVLVRVGKRGEFSFLLFFSGCTRVSRLVELLSLRRDDVHSCRIALS